MPNWVSCDLMINADKGKESEVDRFKKYAKGKNEDLDTDKFIPYPQIWKDMDKKDPNKSFNLGKGKKAEEEKELLVDGLNGID